MKNIFLIGFMGTGKSTIAECLAKDYGMERIEMDQELAERERMSISEIFETYGEAYFRDAETRLLIEIQSEKNKVVSCGGGVVLRDQNLIEMKKGGVAVLLCAKPETILERVRDNDDRPLLRGNMNVEYITDMLDQRWPKYEQAADLIVHTDGKAVEEICREIIKLIGEMGE